MSYTETKEKLEKSDILNIFYNGCKPKSEHKIGLEYERLPLKNNNYKMVDFFEDKGVCNFLRRFSDEHSWDYIVDEYN